jgi:hypothetical protein
VFDFKKNAKHELLGSAETTLAGALCVCLLVRCMHACDAPLAAVRDGERAFDLMHENVRVYVCVCTYMFVSLCVYVVCNHAPDATEDAQRRQSARQLWRFGTRVCRRLCLIKFLKSQEVLSFEMRNEASFMDYLVGGCEISLVVGIDFTSRCVLCMWCVYAQCAFNCAATVRHRIHSHCTIKHL